MDKNFPDYKQVTDWLPLLSSSSIPFQIIWGVHDEIIQYDSKVFPGNVLLKEIENAGHMVHMEQPKEFNQILKEYLIKKMQNGLRLILVLGKRI